MTTDILSITSAHSQVNYETPAFNQSSTPRTVKNPSRVGILKLTQAKLRDKIQDALTRRPMTAYEIAKHQNLYESSVARHLNHLEMLSVVEHFEREGKRYYRLIRH